jgi:hypothetical protein
MKTQTEELFNHLTGDQEKDIYQLRADVRELTEMLAQANNKIESLKTDVSSFKQLSRTNRQEADALRRAAGVPCDDSVREGIERVKFLREKANQ